MRRDLDIVDDSAVIAERVSGNVDDPDLLQGEIDALKKEVEKLGQVAAKVCSYIDSHAVFDHGCRDYQLSV